MADRRAAYNGNHLQMFLPLGIQNKQNTFRARTPENARIATMKRILILFLISFCGLTPLFAQNTVMTRWEKQVIAIRLTADMQKQIDMESLAHNVSIGNKKFDTLASSINTRAIVPYTDPNINGGTEEQWLILYFDSELEAADIVHDFEQLPVVEQAQIIGVKTLAFEEVKKKPLFV